MNVLVIGSGGREHALCYAIRRSPRLKKLFILPGNAGTELLGTNIPGDPSDIDLALSVARREQIDLTIVGPEDPLAAGIVDRFQEAGLRILGPTAAAARLEADKAFSKQLMRKVGVPTADARIFGPTQQEILQRQHAGRGDHSESVRSAQVTGYDLACEYVRTRDEAIVVKASGLAKGKGVFVCESPADALLALERMMLNREFGEAGETVVVEEKLNGREVSLLALVDGRSIYVLEPAQDYKRLLDGDLGPNTGGMGAYCPSHAIDDATMHQVQGQILVPIVDALLREEIVFKGVLYAGLMLTTNGARVLEFNCRFGDPETQAMMMRLRTDVLDMFEATIDGRLDELTLDWDPRASVCVVMAAEGYPDKPRTGVEITGLPETEGLSGARFEAMSPDVTVFHAATKRERGEVVVNGGRVLGITALGETLEDARARAYRVAEEIRFEGAQYRRDIGLP